MAPQATPTRQISQSFCYFCGRPGRAELPCGACMVAMPALFCAGCGARSSPLAASCDRCGELLREPEYPEMPCPACTVAGRAAAPLVRFTTGDVTLHGCTTCRGVFVSARAWCMLLARPELVPDLPPAPPSGSGAVLELVHCPLCKRSAERGRFAGRSPVVVDLCDRHGLWLDAGELAQILAFTAETHRHPVAVESGPVFLASSSGTSTLSSSEASPGRSRGLVLAVAVLTLAGSAGVGYTLLHGKLDAHGQDVKRAAEQAGRTMGK